MRLHLAVTFVLALALLASTTLADDVQLRTWKDATGTFSVTAELVDLQGDTVRLKREDGKLITVALDQLSSADRQYLASLDEKPSTAGGPDTIALNQLTGKPTELKSDDGKPAGKKSFPRGIASAFQVDGDNFYLTEVRIHGSRYGAVRAPREDFHVTLCDNQFKQLADFTFPYSKFDRGSQRWVTLRVKPSKVPREFVICLDFDAEATKGVYVSHDEQGASLVGLPGKPAGRFNGGDWMLRVSVDQPK